MKILKEGTWALKEEFIAEMIDELELFKSRHWHQIGDDTLYDYIDGAQKRLKELWKIKKEIEYPK